MDIKKHDEANFAVLWAAGSGVLGFVLMFLILTYGADVVSGVRDDFTTNSYAYNISTNSLEGMDNIGSKGKSMGSIVAMSVIISLLIAAVGGFVGGRVRG